MKASIVVEAAVSWAQVGFAAISSRQVVKGIGHQVGTATMCLAAIALILPINSQAFELRTR